MLYIIHDIGNQINKALLEINQTDINRCSYKG